MVSVSALFEKSAKLFKTDCFVSVKRTGWQKHCGVWEFFETADFYGLQFFTVSFGILHLRTTFISLNAL